jgi:hypothetical protein
MIDPHRRGAVISACIVLLLVSRALAEEATPSSNWRGFPSTLLWRPMIANQQQPRLSAKLTTLSEEPLDDVIDVAIGGEFGLLRYTSPGGRYAVQPDIFAAGITRFTQNAVYTETDFHVGGAITFQFEKNWHAKVGYEHASTHLGDDFIERTGAVKVGHVRDEIELGLDYVFANQFRVYGQFAYAFHMNTKPESSGDRYGAGIEWSEYRNTGWKGQPYAAVDLEVRADQDYTGNVTVQAGWEWRRDDSNRAVRLGLEYYNGKSPFGQFFREHEQWAGLGCWIDL